MIRPFYVIRILQDENQPVYWKSHSYPASTSLGEATVFRDANSAWEVRQIVKTWTPCIVDVVASSTSLQSILSQS